MNRYLLMQGVKRCLYLAAVTVLISSAVMAHDHQTASAAHAMSDAQAIEHSMKKLFDKPDAPLSVAPVSIEGDYAVAGWIQSGKGGRALLKNCLLYTSPSPRDRSVSRMPSSA